MGRGKHIMQFTWSLTVHKGFSEALMQILGLTCWTLKLRQPKSRRETFRVPAEPRQCITQHLQHWASTFQWWLWPQSMCLNLPLPLGSTWQQWEAHQQRPLRKDKERNKWSANLSFPKWTSSFVRPFHEILSPVWASCISICGLIMSSKSLVHRDVTSGLCCV